MDIGEEEERIVVEPIAPPVPDREPAREPAPDVTPTPDREREPVPA